MAEPELYPIEKVKAGGIEVRVASNLQKEVGVMAGVSEFARRGTAQRYATEDEGPRVKGGVLLPTETLLTDQVNGIELLKASFGYGDGRKNGAHGKEVGDSWSAFGSGGSYWAGCIMGCVFVPEL